MAKGGREMKLSEHWHSFLDYYIAQSHDCPPRWAAFYENLAASARKNMELAEILERNYENNNHP